MIHIAPRRRRNDVATAMPVSGRNDQCGADASWVGLDDILASDNVSRAWERVRGNNGCAGIDGRRIADIAPRFDSEWRLIAAAIREGSYFPQPVKRIRIPKSGGGERRLGVPTVLNRVVQQCIAQALEERWERRFSELSFAYRPNRSAHDALDHVAALATTGQRWALHLDIHEFFDSVSHAALLERVAEGADHHLLELVDRFLKAGVFEGGVLKPTDRGVPQGSPLSPLLSNIMLNDFDHWISASGVGYARYADDCVVLVRESSTADLARGHIATQLQSLGLSLNRSKTRSTPLEQLEFLGHAFVRRRTQVIVRVSEGSLRRCQKQLEILASRSEFAKFEELLRGWINFYTRDTTRDQVDEIRRLALQIHPASASARAPAKADRRNRSVGYSGGHEVFERPLGRSIRLSAWMRALMRQRFLRLRFNVGGGSPRRIWRGLGVGIGPFFFRFHK